MTGLNESSSFGLYQPAQGGHDTSWYGTLGILVACLGLLIVSGIVG